jgi:ribosomal-protein-alanine N-acetyltransferase
VSEPRLLPLGQAQLAAVLKLDAVCFEQEPLAPLWWQKAVTGGEASGWLVERAGQPLAYCLFRQVLDEAELLRLAVAPGERGNGLASTLLRAGQAALRARGISHFFLEVRASNRSAQRVYLRCGWHRCGRRANYYPLAQGREDALLFSWRAQKEDDPG